MTTETINAGMTVGELVKLLSELKQDAYVVSRGADYQITPIDQVVARRLRYAEQQEWEMDEEHAKRICVVLGCWDS